MDITRRTAEAVASAIEAAGKSQAAVAESTGIPRTTLLRRLAGHSPFDVEELQRIADFLGVEVHTLLGSTDIPAGMSA